MGIIPYLTAVLTLGRNSAIKIQTNVVITEEKPTKYSYVAKGTLERRWYILSK